MSGKWLPPNHSLGDANTIGGYARVHARPAAFEGSDGLSYSVSIESAPTGDPDRPVGAFFLFLRWRRIGAQGVDGHLESDFLAWGVDSAEARSALGGLPLHAVRNVLEGLIRTHTRDEGNARRWWDVMRDES